MLLCVGMLLVAVPVWAEQRNSTIRIGLPNSLFSGQHVLVSEWGQYFQNKLHRPVKIVTLRMSKDAFVEQHMGRMDFAWIRDYPDTQIRSRIHLLAIPLYKGQPYFNSYLIVPATDTGTTSLLQLETAVFVFADPSANGSYLETRYELLMAGKNPAHFFRKIFFTHSEREVIEAVALQLANAGSVDGSVWDSLAKARPDLTGQTRIIAKSHKYSAPPLVASNSVSKEDYKAMQDALIGMAQDPKGVELLKRLNLDGFIPGDVKMYEQVVKMKQALGE